MVGQNPAHPVARHSYAVSEQRPTDTFARVLGDYGFDVPYAHRTRCAAAIAVRLQDDLAHWGANPVRGIEPLLALYEVSIVVTKRIDRERARAEKAFDNASDQSS